MDEIVEEFRFLKSIKYGDTMILNGDKMSPLFGDKMGTMSPKFARVPCEDTQNNYSGGEIKKKKFYPFFRLKLKIN